MTRRDLLRGALCAGVAFSVAAIPIPLAAQTGPVFLDMVKNPNGTFSLPSGSASLVSGPRAALMQQASDRALRVAQAQNLSLPKANGLLTRMMRPLAASKGVGGLARELLAAGLIAGLVWSLADGTQIRDTTGSGVLQRGGNVCGSAAIYPLVPNQITSVQTGIYRTSSNGVVAYSRQVVTGWTGGTVPAPAGWTWSFQRNVAGGIEVWFSQQIASANCEQFKFPVVAPVSGPLQAPPETPIPEDVKAAIPDTSYKVSPPITAPPPGQTIEDPGFNVGSNLPGQRVAGPPGVTLGDISQEWTDAFGQDPFFRFPPDTVFGDGSNTGPGGGGPGDVPPGGETPPPGVPYPPGSPVEPNAVGDLPTFDNFSGPFVGLFDPFKAALGGSASCAPVPVPFQFAQYSGTGSFNICPVIEPIAPAIMIVSAGLGAYTAIDNILDA